MRHLIKSLPHFPSPPLCSPPIISHFWSLCFRIGVTQHNDLRCISRCDMDEDVDHLSFQCGFYGRFWYLLSLWLGFDSAIPGTLTYHFWYFTFIVGFSKNIWGYILIIWFSCVWIIWKITYKYYAIKLSYSHFDGWKQHILWSSSTIAIVDLILFGAFSLFHSVYFVFLLFSVLVMCIEKSFFCYGNIYSILMSWKTKQKHLTLSHLFGHVELASHPFRDMCPPFGTFYLAIIISMFP
jgi:hypothetical protein